LGSVAHCRLCTSSTTRANAADEHRGNTTMKTNHNLNRFIVGALVSAGVAVASLGLAAGTAQAQPGLPFPTDDGGWGPPRQWCPGQSLWITGNHVTNPVIWDNNVCHTYYMVDFGMGNVAQNVWDGPNPPPKPNPPPMIGLYCDPGNITNCHIADHPG